MDKNNPKNEPEWIEAKNIKENHFIAINLGYERTDYLNSLKEDRYCIKDNMVWIPLKNIEIIHGNTKVYNIEVNHDNSYNVHGLICKNCQDYSVASTNAKGIEGKKGVLWWNIYNIIDDKRPPYILLENVDRLLKSPSNQRGRDFAIILASLNNLGYGVE